MLPNSSELPTPAPVQPPIPDRYREVLEAPLPTAESLDTPARVARIQLYKEMRQQGIFVPPEHLRHAITLVTLDRAAKASEARKTSSSAKKAVSAAIPSIEDL